MSKSDVFETDFLSLIFNAIPMANIADNAATAPLTNLYLSLHTADPGEAGTQATSETTYTGYARLAIARTGGGWVVSGNTVALAANADFGEWTAGVGTLTHFGIGTAASGAGKLLFSGTITPNIVLGAGVIPRISTAPLITED